MGILSWGKPKVEIVVSTAGAVPATPTWIEMPTIKEGTAKLIPTKGKKTEHTGEGGELVEVAIQKNKYAFECECFVKKSATRPITDADGHVSDHYAVRLTPEDDTQEGFIMENCAVTCEESWSADTGKMLKYTFDGLKPASGNILKSYTKTT